MAQRGQKGWICTHESNDGGKKAEVIIKTDKVSDVGRLFNDVENGLKVLAKVKLIYYIDKGWHIVFGYNGSVSRDSDIGVFYGFNIFIFK